MGLSSKRWSDGVAPMVKRIFSILGIGLVYLACSSDEGDDKGDGEDDGGSSATGSGATGNTSGSAQAGGSGGGSSGGNCRADAGLTASCEQLCAAFQAADCQLLDLSVPYIYRLYVGSGESHDDCVKECVEGDLRQGSLADTPSKCGPELSQYIARTASKTCVNRDPARNFDGQWDWTGLADAAENLTGCGERCLDLPSCNSSTCNGSMSAGSVFCSWSCSGRICEQSCN
jgi:hypothetical protein